MWSVKIPKEFLDRKHLISNKAYKKLIREEKKRQLAEEYLRGYGIANVDQLLQKFLPKPLVLEEEVLITHRDVGIDCTLGSYD
ncbi:unnamed protein product [Oppiella nova]|uniref:Uncharacterized protein n=1 Tax=Oppiella nova TaxID=334625 RepID=A0A7R9MEW2_9ACAR|nr:unnamed protein product [Oppiella nova]CAG2176105.1 unnamed protein product [Oppiella nova]